MKYVYFSKIKHCIFAKIVTFFLIFIRTKDSYDGEPSGRRITRVMNTFWYLLRTVHNLFVQCFSYLLKDITKRISCPLT